MHPEGFQQLLPENDGGGNLRLGGQGIVKTDLFLKNIDYMGPAKKFIAINGGISSQFLHPFVGQI